MNVHSLTARARFLIDARQSFFKRLSSIFFLLLSSILFASCGRQVFTGKEEARGVWMSRFEYANAEARNNPDVAKARIREVFDKARSARMNMVIFQVRGNGDALYRSSHEPWSHLLSGTLGKDPGWDPLAFALDEAHKRGLELHAWMNVFPVWRDSLPPPQTAPPSPYYAHPEWVICDSAGTPMVLDPPNNNYVWVSPGNPEVRSHILGVVNEVLTTYDVDGIHFDYIRYPEGSPSRGYSHDPVSVARFNSAQDNPGHLSWDHWQREQVNQFVFDAYTMITAAKPWVKVSASVIGKYSGSGWTAYHVVYQDPRRWMEVGKMDFIVPMVYWERAHPTHPFIPLITEWQDRVAYSRQVVPGLATRMLQRVGWSELEAQIEEVRALKLPGVVFYNAAGLEKAWDLVGGRSFPYWAKTPGMPWKADTRPTVPTGVTVQKSGSSVVVAWNPMTDPSHSAIVYRGSSPAIDLNDAYAIAAITPRGSPLATIPDDGSEWFRVSFVNRIGIEGLPSDAVRAAVAFSNPSN